MAMAGLGILLYLIVAVATDSKKLGGALARLGWTGCCIVLSLSLINYALRFVRWHAFIGMLGHRVPINRHLLLYLSGFAFTVSPAKAGEAVRSMYLRQYGVSYPESIAALFVERLQDLLAMVLLSGLMLTGQRAYWPLVVGTFGITTAIILVARSAGFARTIGAYGNRGTGRLRKGLKMLAALLLSSQRLLRARASLPGIILGVVSWGAEGVGFYMICEGLQLHVGVAASAGIYAIAALAGGAAFFLPAGIGGMEVVMTALLAQRGAPVPAAIIATLLCRLATLWFAVAVGLGCGALLETHIHTRNRRLA